MEVFGLRFEKTKMKSLHPQGVFFCAFLCFFCSVYSLKCRTTTEAQHNTDFEYVVRMCLRHMRNESDIYDLYRIQSDYDSGKNNRYRDEMSGGNSNSNNDNRNYYGRYKGYSEGFDRFWPSGKAPHDRNKYNDDGNFEYSDFFGGSRNSKDGRKKYRGRPQMPHSYQQQLQHDRDVLYGQGNREPNYFYPNRNKNTKLTINKDKNSDSPLNDIDSCVIYCIFQEMQMVDDNGKPNKGLISQKMTQKIRNSELKNFIQESVEECFDVIGDDDFETSYGGYSNYNNNNNNNRYRQPEMMCEWAKTFAICLEDRGRENCDDWNEPLQKNYNNNNNNKNNEDQRHKSKQNDRG